MSIINEIADRDIVGTRLSLCRAVAYYRPDLNVTVTAPVPLNLVLGWWHTQLLPTLLHGYQARWLRAIKITHDYDLQNAWHQGFLDGLLEAQRIRKEATP